MDLSRGHLLARPFGIPLLVHASWVPAAGLLGFQLFASAFSGLPAATAVPMAALTTLLFFASVAAHELAHALAARRCGIGVADITLFVFGGVARLVREPATPRQEVVVAAAGPAFSAAAGLAALIPAGTSPSGRVWTTLAVGNLTVAVFNLMPGFPLDGGRLLRAWLWSRTGDAHRATVTAGRAGQLLAAGIVVAGGVLGWRSRHLEAIWLVVIGAFLWRLAGSARRGSRMAARLGRDGVDRLVSPFAGTVDAGTMLASVAARAGAGTDLFAVSAAGRLAGVVEIGPHAGGANGATIREAMVPWNTALAFPRSGSLMDALSVPALADAGFLVVVDEDGSAVGVLTKDAVRNHLAAASRTTSRRRAPG